MRTRNADVAVEVVDDTFKDDDALLRNALSTRSLASLMPSVTVNRTFALTLGRDVASHNQASSGRCWIFANINAIRRVMLARLGWSHQFTLSPSYVYYHSALEQCNTALEVYYAKAKQGVRLGSCGYQNELWRPSDGGDVHNFMALLEKHGIVPYDVYPDTHAARNSSVVETLLHASMRIAATHIFPTDDSAAISRRSFDVVKRRVMTSVQRTLSALLGAPTTGFDFLPRLHREGGSKSFEAPDAARTQVGGGRATCTYTPGQFYAQYVRGVVSLEHCIHLANDPRHAVHTWIAPQRSVRVLKPGDGERGTGIGNLVADVYWNVSCGAMKAAALRCLRSGRPVIFACDMKHFYSVRLGYLGRAASTVPRLFPGADTWDMASEPASKGRALNAQVVGANHEMCFIGYDAATDTWEVENSWGASKPLTMTGAWFERFVYSLCLLDTHMGAAAVRLVRSVRLPLVANATAHGMPLDTHNRDDDCGDGGRLHG